MGDTGAGVEKEFLFVQFDGLGEAGQQALGDLGGFASADGYCKAHAAETGNTVETFVAALAELLPQALGDNAQNFVADCVAERIVDAVEVDQVDDQQ